MNYHSPNYLLIAQHCHTIITCYRPPNMDYNICLNELTDIGESNRLRTVPEYEHFRYLRNHISYKKSLMNKIIIII